MNNKGLTLVETIAVLIILAIVAVIAVPNIAKNLRKGKNNLTDVQVNTVKTAAKNWSFDNLDKLKDDENALKLTVAELQEDGYLDEKVIDPKDKNGNNIAVFAIIKQTKLANNNYKYEYGAYYNMDDYYKTKAIQYAEDNELESVTITTKELKSQNYLFNLIDLQDNLIEVEEKQITVTKTKNEYKAEIN